MSVAYFLIIATYFSVAAYIFCMTFILIPVGSASAFRTGNRGRAYYVMRALLALAVWVILSAIAFYVPFLKGAGDAGWVWNTLLMAVSAWAYFLSGKFLLHLMSRRAVMPRRLSTPNALRAR